MVVTDAVGKIDLQDGSFTVSPLSGSLFDGDVKGAVTIGAADTPVAVQGKLHARGIDVGKLLGAVANSTFAGGQGDFALDIRSQGNSVAALMANLSGKVGLLVSEGTAELRAAENMTTIANLLTAQLVANGDTRVKLNCLAGDLHIENGVAKVMVLLMDTERSTVRGAGRIDLGAETLHLAFKPEPKTPAMSLATPIVVTGTLTEPESSPEKLGALRRIAGVASLFVFPPAAVAGLGELGNRENACLKLAATP